MSRLQFLVTLDLLPSARTTPDQVLDEIQDVLTDVGMGINPATVSVMPYPFPDDGDVENEPAEENPREKGDDDGVEYADPRDYRDGLE
jgi:hypothetical protein